MIRFKLYYIAVLLFCISSMNAQSFEFADDAIQRGYYDRPYLRYEAEPGVCITDGVFLDPSFDQRTLQSEASNQAAVQLIAYNSYVEWTNEQPADGLTIRFSLPDDASGNGTTGILTLLVNGNPLQSITLNSYWAWQYILKSGSKYPDNIPDENTKFPRMRFDEMHLKLNEKIPVGATVRLVKSDENQVPYTIDFIELENVPEATTFESLTDENKIMYTSESGSLPYFISQNGGKTIFLPAGKYEVDNRISINTAGTKIIGAGMWYTEIYFNASSDERTTYNKRGIESYSNNIVLEGMYLNTINNKRYYNNDPAYQVGKGLMGSFGSDSRISNLWIEHFECGGWIEQAINLEIQHCRFRNNYADGMNLAYGCRFSSVEHSSYRNNGDDDMASWSRSTGMCEGNVYAYSTSENNWRASALGFFGGKQNIAHDILIIDPMEAGFRVTCDFPGMPFSDDGYSEFYNISVYKGGVAAGTVGVSGDLWGNQQGALHINSSSQYDLQNISIHNIEFIDSKNDAIFIGSGTRVIKNLIMKDIHVDGTGRYGIYFYSSKGNGRYCNMQYENIGASSQTNSIPAAFSFIENCSPASVSVPRNQGIGLTSVDGNLFITGQQSTEVLVYDILGRKRFQGQLLREPVVVSNLATGIYIVKWNGDQAVKVRVN